MNPRSVRANWEYRPLTPEEWERIRAGITSRDDRHVLGLLFMHGGQGPAKYILEWGGEYLRTNRNLSKAGLPFHLSLVPPTEGRKPRLMHWARFICRIEVMKTVQPTSV